VTGPDDSPIGRAYAELLRSAVDWVWQSDADLTLTYCSAGLGREIGRTLHALAAPEDSAVAPSPLLAALRERRSFYDCPVELVDDAGQPVSCRLTGVPFQDESNGDFAGYRGTARRLDEDREDGATAQRLLELLQSALSEKDRLERQVARFEAQEARTQAGPGPSISTLAPELRSPLSAILAFSEIIRDRRFGDDPQRYAEHAGAIHRGARQLLQLLSQPSDPADGRFAAGGDEESFHIVPLDIGEIVRSVVTVIGDEAAEAEVRLSTVLARDLPAARGDERLVRQILLHLIGRSIALASPGTTVLLRAVSDPAGGIAVSVVEGVAAETEAREHGTEGFPEPRVGAFEDASIVVLRHLAESMDADLSLTGRPGQGGQALLRLPADYRQQDRPEQAQKA
jgi:signal transduction histidine kinase